MSSGRGEPGAGDRPHRTPAAPELEAAIARLLLAGTLAGVVLLLVGVGLMAATGIDPTESPSTGFEAGRVLPDVLAARPAGFLWAGIVVLIATPIARVLGELVAFAYRRDGLMTGVAAAILGIIALSVALATQ